MDLGVKVAVVVLGDVGRSPRMQYHALSFSEQDWVGRVSLVGLEGQACIAEVEKNEKIDKVLMAQPITMSLPRSLLLFYAPVKILQQMVQLTWALTRISGLDVVVLQNPPCIPTFLVLAFVKWVRGIRVVVDWHNLGFTILAMSFASEESHPIVVMARLYEKILSRLVVDAHLCVTQALKGWLQENFGLDGTTICVQYDRPPAFYRPLTNLEQHQFWERMSSQLFGYKKNLFTQKRGRGASKRPGRPALIVSSTSWTADEDFGILLDALKAFEKDERSSSKRLICVVTGKGPKKEFYKAKIKELEFHNVEVYTPWLEQEDYPKLLGCMDLGVCLHTSSSNLDLPMKVVDMFGAGIPVCAFDYPCLNELVLHQSNGLVFTQSQELASQLKYLLLDEDGQQVLEEMRFEVKKFAELRWKEHWEESTGPFIKAQGKGRWPASFFFIVVVVLEAFLYTFLYRSS